MPDYIVWRDEYSVRFDEIDKQHRQIIGIINDMYQCVKGNGTEDKFAEALGDLRTYTETHFAYEEGIIRLAEFPEIEEHEKLHHAMAEKTEWLFKLKLGNQNQVKEKALDFLKEWWVGHIRAKDVEYIPFVEALSAKIKKSGA
ncbi:MAG: hemerythrin family protein [Chitinivibrionales bacterium]|nr:hemerythrin family protein [Chitinivibrionales bacterium]